VAIAPVAAPFRTTILRVGLIGHASNLPGSHTAAALLRFAHISCAADLIDAAEHDIILFEVIDWLEGH
jgi:hypothetical protein